MNRDQLVRGAAVFGAGLLKGVIISALINQSNSGITIGWIEIIGINECLKIKNKIKIDCSLLQ